MYWFELIGLSLGFAGSVLFSAGLIKTPEQIRDENQTYFDKNFFTYEAEMTSRKLLIAAFLLMIAGFAVSAAGVIAEQFAGQQILIGILLSITFMAVGFLLTALFYIRRVNRHRQLKYSYVKRLFTDTVQVYLDRWDAVEKLSFTDEKTSIQGALKERFSRLNPEDNENESRLLTRIDTTRKMHSLKEVTRQYLADVKNDA